MSVPPPGWSCSIRYCEGTPEPDWDMTFAWPYCPKHERRYRAEWTRCYGSDDCGGACPAIQGFYADRCSLHGGQDYTPRTTDK